MERRPPAPRPRTENTKRSGARWERRSQEHGNANRGAPHRGESASHSNSPDSYSGNNRHNKTNKNAQHQTHAAKPKAQILFVDVCARMPSPPAGAYASGSCAGRAASSASPEQLCSAKIPPAPPRLCIPSPRQCLCAGHGEKRIYLAGMPGHSEL